MLSDVRWRPRTRRDLQRRDEQLRLWAGSSACRANQQRHQHRDASAPRPGRLNPVVDRIDRHRHRQMQPRRLWCTHLRRDSYNSADYDAQYTSPDTGLIYLRARTYDPATAQFLSVDPEVGRTQAPPATPAIPTLLYRSQGVEPQRSLGRTEYSVSVVFSCGTVGEALEGAHHLDRPAGSLGEHVPLVGYRVRASLRRLLPG